MRPHLYLVPSPLTPPPTPAAIHGSAPLPTLVRRAAHAHEVAALRADLQRARRALHAYRGSPGCAALVARRVRALEADLRDAIRGHRTGGAA